jgi:hypothetical protein
MADNTQKSTTTLIKNQSSAAGAIAESIASSTVAQRSPPSEQTQEAPER